MKVVRIEDIYLEILTEKRKMFPKNTWNPLNGGRDNFVRCLRFLVNDYLKIDRDAVVTNFNQSFLTKWKLRGGLWLAFGDSTYDALNLSFPEWNVKFWEMQRSPVGSITKNSVISEVRDLYNNKLNWNREDIINNGLSYTFFKRYGIEKLVKNGSRYGNNRGLFGVINMSFPEYEFRIWEFNNQRWTKEDVRLGLLWFFEDFLKWSIQDIRNNLHNSVFDENGFRKLLSRFDDKLYNLLSFVYPEENWEDFKGVRYTESYRDKLKTFGNAKLTTADVIDIKIKINSGKPRKDIASEYNVNISTIDSIINGKSWSNIE